MLGRLLSQAAKFATRIRTNPYRKWVQTPTFSKYRSGHDSFTEKIKIPSIDLKSIAYSTALGMTSFAFITYAAAQENQSISETPEIVAVVANSNQTHEEHSPIKNDQNGPIEVKQGLEHSDAAHSDEPVPTKSEYVIVGGGSSSFYAINELLNIDPEAQITLICSEDIYPYDKSTLSKTLWHQRDFEKATNLTFTDIDGESRSIVYASKEFYEKFPNVNVILGKDVIDLEPSKQKLTLEDGSQIIYKACLLAVGTEPIKSKIHNLPKQGISTMHSVKDYELVNQATLDPKTKHVTVVGNDTVSTDLATSLVLRSRYSQNGMAVSQIYPESGLLSSIFPEYYSQYLNGKMKRIGVDIHPNTNIKSIDETPEASHKLKITMEDESTIDTDFVVFSLGSKPSTFLAQKGSLEVDPNNGGIVVNSEMQTRTGLYVSGDAASYYDSLFGRRNVTGLDHAEMSSRVAAWNMQGAHRAYTYQPVVWGSIAHDAFYQGVGIIDPSLETVSVWAKGPAAPLVTDTETNKQIPDPQFPPSTLYEDKNAYESGVIYYMKNNEIVGTMMINVTNKMQDAKRLVMSPRKFADTDTLQTQIYLGNRPSEEEDEEEGDE